MCGVIPLAVKAGAPPGMALGGLAGPALHSALKKKPTPTASQTFYGGSVNG